MSQMAKMHTALPENMVKALSIIETETDRPRTRIIRRAVADYIAKYAAENPGFMERVGSPIEVERELKPGLQTDVVVVRGIKKEVIITADGWRLPTDDDYLASSSESGVLATGTSILDQ